MLHNSPKVQSSAKEWNVISKYVCMYVIFIRCDKRTSNNKHKKQSQNEVQYKAAKPKNYKTIKTISLDKAI